MRKVLIAFLALLLAGPAIAANWPGGAAPCNTTLQACISGTAAGGFVLVSTSAVIDESLTINKPFSLLAAPGFRPVLAADRTIGGTINVPGTWTWTLDGFELTRGLVSVNVDGGNGFVLIRRVRVREGLASGLAEISLSNDSPEAIYFELAQNEVDYSWSTSDGALRAAIQVLDRGTSSTNGRIIENRVVARGTQSIGILLSTVDRTSRIGIGGNHVIGGARGSIYLRQGSLLDPTGGNLSATVVSNLVRSVEPGSASAYGIRFEILDGRATATVLHNTVVDAFRGVYLDASSGTGPMNGRVGRNLFANLSYRGLDRSGTFTPSNAPDDRNLYYDTADTAASVAPDSIFADPLLVRIDDPHLRAGSPAIDAADGTELVEVLVNEDLPQLDGDGLRRFKRVLPAAPPSPADIGALEHGDFSQVHAIPAGAGITSQIDDPALNARSTAYPQITANWNPDGSTGVYANHPASLFYGSSRWSVRREDLAPLVAGSDFNLFVPAEGAGRFRHAITAASVTGSETRLDAVGLNGQSERIVLATRDPLGSASVVDLVSPLALRYSASIWSVVRLDGATMPVSGGFHVYFQESSFNAFRHTTSTGNISANYSLIDHSLLNGKRCARIHVAQSANGTLNESYVGVFYARGAGRWAIFNQDLAAMPTGVRFHVLVDPARSECASELFSNGFEG